MDNQETQQTQNKHKKVSEILILHNWDIINQTTNQKRLIKL